MRSFKLVFLAVFFVGQIQAKQPNIIFILADDLGYGDLGCYGQKLIQTPRIDQMAEEGMRFTEHYSGSPVCAPARAVLMTGKHTGNTPVRGNRQNDLSSGQMPLPKSELTIATVLKEAGYHTAFFGKWGLGNVDTMGNPLRRGFDEYHGYLDQVLAHNAFPEYLLKNGEKLYLDNVVQYVDPDAWHKGLGSYSLEKNTFSQDIFIAESLSFISENRDNTFFLYLPWIIPHDNGEAPKHQQMESPGHGVYAEEDWEDNSKAYAAAISRMDQDVGRILDHLEALGIAENTLVIFTSDNGPLPEKFVFTERFQSNGPFRGSKRDLYEGGIRVPFVAWWPGSIEAGQVSDHPSAFYDFFATACEVAELDVPENVDGISYLPTLLGNPQPSHEYLYWEFPIRSPGNGYGYQVAVRLGKWKGIRVDLLNNPDAAIELYNLDVDPAESTDLAAEYSELVDRINRIMHQAHTSAAFFPELPLLPLN